MIAQAARGRSAHRIHTPSLFFGGNLFSLIALPLTAAESFFIIWSYSYVMVGLSYVCFGLIYCSSATHERRPAAAGGAVPSRQDVRLLWWGCPVVSGRRCCHPLCASRHGKAGSRAGQ